MDNIDRFFKNHKKQFDFLATDPDNHREGWEQLEEQLHGKVRRFPPPYIAFLAMAASVLLLLGWWWNSHSQPWSEQPNNNPPATLATLIGLDEDQYFPDLALTNPEGDVVSLSALQTQLVLVDFWASYCMVCNEENCYYFKPLYDEYRHHGFEIYAVSADTSATHWINAIERDSLSWVQVSDLQGLDSPVLDQYEVEALPTNYLLDQNGRIIAKNINVDELENRLRQLFAYQ